MKTFNLGQKFKVHLYHENLVKQNETFMIVGIDRLFHDIHDDFLGKNNCSNSMLYHNALSKTEIQSDVQESNYCTLIYKIVNLTTGSPRLVSQEFLKNQNVEFL